VIRKQGISMSTRLALTLSIASLLVVGTNSIAASELYFVDAYSEVEETITALDVIIKNMDRENVYRTILAARGQRKPRDIVAFAGRNRGRIIPAVRTVSVDYYKNKPRYYESLRRQVDSGRFRAMGQVALYAIQKGDFTHEVTVRPGAQQVQAALKAAVRQGWPFIVHLEFEGMGGVNRKHYMEDFEKLVQTYPEHPFLLYSMGQLVHQDARNLLLKYKNIYFLTMHVNPVVNFSRVQSAWVNIFEGDALKPEWKNLFLEFPERFVFALGNVWDAHWNNDYPKQMEYWRSALAELPEHVAHAIAHGNAERLWNIPPKPSQ
jgi:predicted TIM-barrel fold metal-dependent hydrolase